jgi:peptide/nickel transport system permease protein
MGALLLRRLRDLVIILVLVGTGVFFIVHLLPGNPAVAMLGSFATKDQIAALSHSMGFDQPLGSQYLLFVNNLFHGNLGRSTLFQQPVLNVVLGHAIPTLVLAVVTTVISLIIAVPAAVFSAARPNSIWARLVTPTSVFGIAVPGFWLSLVLVLVFGVAWQVLPIGGYVPLTQNPVGWFTHLVLPVIVLVAGQAALFVRTLRESILGELSQLYLRTARAKGAKDRIVLLRQALPNALLPTITVVGTSLGTLLGGIVIIENIFVIPGLGALLLQAIESRDYPLIEGITLVIAIAYIIVNLIADLLYVVADPRIRLR